MRQHAGPARVGHQVVAQPGAGRDGAREDAESGPGELLVAADVVGVHARVDDVADGQRRQTPDRRQHLVGHRRRTGVDEDDAVGSDLHDDVAAGAADDVEVRAQLHDVETATLLLRRDRTLRGTVKRHSRSDRDRPDRCQHPAPPTPWSHRHPLPDFARILLMTEASSQGRRAGPQWRSESANGFEQRGLSMNGGKWLGGGDSCDLIRVGLRRFADSC